MERSVWLELMWVRIGPLVGVCENGDGRNFYQGDKNVNEDYLTKVKIT
jgi:hypothetical protein